MAEEEFEIDIYGDANADQGNVKHEDSKQEHDMTGYHEDDGGHDTNGHGDYDGGHHEEDMDAGHGDDQSHHNSNSNSHSAPQQGVKRKEGSDERPVDPGATTAIMISDLSWWNTDDDIRGWVRRANCEDELKDITFSEHKVNGKSKGCVAVSLLALAAGLTDNIILDKRMLSLRPSKPRLPPNIVSTI